jgi:hypothetical protein
MGANQESSHVTLMPYAPIKEALAAKRFDSSFCRSLNGHGSIYHAAMLYFDPIIAPAPLRICPMGDSITAGFIDNPD